MPDVDARSEIRLARGRRLTYGALGPRDGFPVVYLHGAIGSPVGRDDGLVAALEALGVRLFAPERPGFGGAPRAVGRTVLDHAADVAALADALGLERLAVAGVSAGGPYALACAARLGDRLTAAAVVSSLSPGGGPVLLRAARALPQMAGGDARGDARPAAAGLAGLRAAARGLGGLLDDHVVTTRRWGFDLAAVTGAVHVWHGMQDPIVPADHALQLAAALPRCRVWLHPDEGHFFFRRRAAEILGALLPAAALSAPPARRERTSPP